MVLKQRVWIDVHTVGMKHEASTEAKPFSQVISWIRIFSNFFRPSNIWYQTCRSKGQQVWFIFWRLGVQTSASTQTTMSRVNVSRDLSGQSPFTHFQLGRDSVVKHSAECLLQLQSCCIWRRVHSLADMCEFRRILVLSSSRLSSMERAGMVSSDIWKKDEVWSWDRTDKARW